MTYTLLFAESGWRRSICTAAGRVPLDRTRVSIAPDRETRAPFAVSKMGLGNPLGAVADAFGNAARQNGRSSISRFGGNAVYLTACADTVWFRTPGLARAARVHRANQTNRPARGRLGVGKSYASNPPRRLLRGVFVGRTDHGVPGDRTDSNAELPAVRPSRFITATTTRRGVHEGEGVGVRSPPYWLWAFFFFFCLGKPT